MLFSTCWEHNTESNGPAARTYYSVLLWITLLFCFAPVGATVVSQAKPRTLASFEVSERPKGKSNDVSQFLEYEGGIFVAQRKPTSLTSAVKLSAVSSILTSRKSSLGGGIFENFRSFKVNKLFLKDYGGKQMYASAWLASAIVTLFYIIKIPCKYLSSSLVFEKEYL